MQIEVNELEPCKLAIKYEAGAMEILDKRGQVIDAFKKAPVPGFRPGKASADAIKVHYRQQIEESLKRALAEDAYHNTLFEKKIRPHGAPKFTNILMDGGKFICEFEMYTKPEFELADFRNLEVPKPHEPFTGVEAAEQMMQELRVRFGETRPFEDDNDFVQTGDNVILDYEGTINGEIVPHLTAQGEMITIGKSQVASFDDNLLGMKVGEVREFDFNVPEGGLPSISGKTVHFKVTLVQGAKHDPAPLDDTLAVKLGKANFNELREFVQATAEARISNSFKMRVNEAIAKKLVADNNINVPNWMSLSEAQYLAHQSQLDWNQMPDEDKERFLDMGVQNVKLSLVLDKIRETEPEAQLTDQEVFEVIKRNLAQTKINKPMDEIMQELNRTGYLQILFSRIRDEHTMDYVAKTAKVIE